MKKDDPNAGKVTRRRITWAELYKLRPDLRPANDNTEKELPSKAA